MNNQSQRTTIDGTAGLLEVLVDEPVPMPRLTPVGTAVIAHPHPQFGGTMDNKVVQTLARAFVLCGWRAVRFNFRGVGKSQGAYDAGHGELADLLSVVAHFAAEGPLALAGFSFGSFVTSHAVQALAVTQAPEKVVLVGTAASRFQVAPIAPELHERTLVIHGELDETVPLADVMAWARPQSLPVTVIPGGEHFFHGQLPLLRGLVVRHLSASHV
jgi:uncharacterized protein